MHLDPDYRGRRAVLVNLTTVAPYLRPALELIGGDFNMSITDPRWPLAPACRAHGCLRRYRPALPRHTPTHFMPTKGRRSATAIDHIFLCGAWSVPDADVLPSPTPHCPVLATVDQMEGLADVRSWRLIRWCSAPERAVSRLAALLHLAPNAFLQALWSAACHVIPQPRPIDHVLQDLRARSHPRTAEEIADFQALLSDTVAHHMQERPDQVLRQTTITSATGSALHRPSKPLSPYGQIRPDRGVELPTAAARLAEVTEQASATTHHRGHTMDVDFLTAAFDPHKWTPFFDPIQHIPASLLGDMLYRGVDPRDPQARGLSIQVALGPPLRVCTTVTAAGSLFAGLDQCPKALLEYLRRGGVQEVQHHLQFVNSGYDSLS